MGCFSKIISPVTSILDDLTGKDEAEKQIKKAQKAQAAALDKSLSAEERMFNKGLSYADPYHNAAVTAIPQLLQFAGYTPNASGEGYTYGGVPTSPLYQWQKEQGEKDISRRLNMLGRGNSTFGANTFRDFYSGLNASEAARQENTLLNLMKIGQGSAGTATSAAQNQGNALASLYGNYANNMGNLYAQQGQLATSFSPFKVGLDVAGAAAQFIPFAGGGKK